MTSKLAITAIAMIFAQTVASPSVFAEPINHPNVVLIMTDDQGWGDLHYHGNANIDTPQLDRLSRQSVRMEHFFVSPVCAPTRAALLTGRYDFRTGVSGVTGRLEVMRAEELTLAEAFKSADYATGCFGKWHNGEQFPNNPLGQGFDEFFGFCGGHWNNYFDTPMEHNGRWVPTKGYITDVVTDAALAFIDQQKDKRFFCYVPYNAPHSPWQVPDKYFEKYAARGLETTTACAYGMVENLDENIGRILSRLDDLQLARNTVVVFLTDNGPNGKRYNGQMRGAKGSVHEGGMRVPCVIRWPEKLQPRDVQPIAAHIDLFPTLLELCGIACPTEFTGPDEVKSVAKPRDGRSLVPLLQGAAQEWPNRELFTYRAGKSAGSHRATIRTDRYRFVHERGNGQLFDMLEDPSQRHDVATKHSRVFTNLTAKHNAWLKEAAFATAHKPAIPVGYACAPQVELPAVEAELQGHVRFRNVNGYAHDWITNWSSVEDRIVWDLDNAATGEFEVSIDYACGKQNTGSTIFLAAGDRNINFQIQDAFDKGEQARPERSLAKGPRWLREFTTQRLGAIQLPAGRCQLVLRATNVSGDMVCELNALKLRLVK